MLRPAAQVGREQFDDDTVEAVGRLQPSKQRVVVASVERCRQNELVSGYVRQQFDRTVSANVTIATL